MMKFACFNFLSYFLKNFHEIFDKFTVNFRNEKLIKLFLRLRSV